MTGSDRSVPQINGRALPQQLLATLLGDYWRGHREAIPSAALVELLEGFGISAAGARAALSRLARRGVILQTRHGRRTAYRLSESALQIIDEGAARLFEFEASVSPWDGIWSMVAFSVADENRWARQRFRTKLRRLRFGPLYDGLWISPHNNLSEVATAASELGIKAFNVFRASQANLRASEGQAGNAIDPVRVWRLDDIAAEYLSFVTDHEPLLEVVYDRRMTPADALVQRTSLMERWRRFPRRDPDLPSAFLPPDWPRPQAQKLFLELYRAMGPLASTHVSEVMRRHNA